MRLWDWASQAYARPGVEALCLKLQDEHGQCVSYLLWAAWMAHRGSTVDQARLARAAAVARFWETTTLRRLRSYRRALKHPAPRSYAERVRKRILTEELATERLLLKGLEALTPPARVGAVDLGQTLRDAVAAWGVLLSPALLEDLIEAFSDG